MFARPGAHKAAEQRTGGGMNSLSVACDVSRRDQVNALVKSSGGKIRPY